METWKRKEAKVIPCALSDSDSEPAGMRAGLLSTEPFLPGL